MLYQPGFTMGAFAALRPAHRHHGSEIECISTSMYTVLLRSRQRRRLRVTRPSLAVSARIPPEPGIFVLIRAGSPNGVDTQPVAYDDSPENTVDCALSAFFGD